MTRSRVPKWPRGVSTSTLNRAKLAVPRARKPAVPPSSAMPRSATQTSPCSSELCRAQWREQCSFSLVRGSSAPLIAELRAGEGYPPFTMWYTSPGAAAKDRLLCFLGKECSCLGNCPQSHWSCLTPPSPFLHAWKEFLSWHLKLIAQLVSGCLSQPGAPCGYLPSVHLCLGTFGIPSVSSWNKL